MASLVIVLSLLSVLLILPGWLWFRRKQTQSLWLLALPIFGIALWVALTLSGIGPQSLSNLVESFGVAATAITVTYVKFLVLDRSPFLRSRGTAIAFAVVVLVTFGFRLLMPSLPE